MTDNLEDKYVGCLLGGAIGDALGFTSENLSRERIARKYGRITDFHVKPGWGYYTDDTQLTIMLAETLIECGGFDAPTFRRKLARWWIVPPRLSGRSTKNAGLKCLLGLKETGRNVPGTSGAMRSAPLGLFYWRDEAALFDATVESCRATHTHPSAIAGALVTSFSVAYALQAARLDIPEYLAKISEVASRFDPDIGRALQDLAQDLGEPEANMLPKLLQNSNIVGSPVKDVILTAVYALLKHPEDFEQSVLVCVNAGWDTDTMAAIHGNIAGALHGIDGIPQRWIAHLENGYKGRDYLIGLAQTLCRGGRLAPARPAVLDYALDLQRNTAFLFNMVRRKPMF